MYLMRITTNTVQYLIQILSIGVSKTEGTFTYKIFVLKIEK
jgi:hypothetical protein